MVRIDHVPRPSLLATRSPKSGHQFKGPETIWKGRWFFRAPPHRTGGTMFDRSAKELTRLRVPLSWKCLPKDEANETHGISPGAG